MQRLVSIDLSADFAFFRKPDINDGISLSYNMLHKPALLGVLGAILGLGGYQKKGEWPEYHTRLKHIPTGVEPLGSDCGNFSKTVITYNNSVGYANKDGNWILKESTLVNPTYRCYFLLNEGNSDEKKLLEYLEKGWAEFIPYLGKNEHTAWWENFQEYAEFEVKTVFRKNAPVNVDEEVEFDLFAMDYEEMEEPPFYYFERLPVGFDERLYQYELGEFVYTDRIFTDRDFSNLFKLENDAVVQLN